MRFIFLKFGLLLLSIHVNDLVEAVPVVNTTTTTTTSYSNVTSVINSTNAMSTSTALQTPCQNGVQCQNGGTCSNFLDSFVCYCTSDYVGRRCDTQSQFSLISNSTITDYSPLLAQLEITSNYLKGIEILSDIFAFDKVASSIFKVFSGVMSLVTGLFTPSFEEILFDYLKQQFDLLNRKLDVIYSQIIQLNNQLTLYFNQLSQSILNSQIVITAISNINKMDVYRSDASNMIIDLRVYLGERILNYLQIQATCGQSFNPQHYLNIIDQFANTSIFDSSVGSSYNLMYNIMTINDFADYPTYSIWYQKLFLLSYNLAYYGQICDSANNLSLVFQNQSSQLRNKTINSILSGFKSQINELKSNTYYGQFMGCFVDNATNRDLPFMPYTSSTGMSVGFCLNYCQQYGYQYAGLQMGTDCWCGNNYGTQGNASFTDCKYPCSDLTKNRQFCGGYLRNLVFKTSIVTPCYPNPCQKTIEIYRYYRGNFHMATTLTNQSEINRIYGAGMRSFGGISYRILASPGNNTIPIYECYPNYPGQFITTDKNCERTTFLRLSGYLYNTPVANSVAIFRKVCCSYNNHWITQDRNEGGGTVEGILGYGLLKTTYTNA